MAEATSDRPDPADLGWIRALMEDTQRSLAGTWKHHLLWGVLSALGLALTWVFLWAGVPRWTLAVWPPLLASGWALSFRIGWRDSARAPVRTTALRGVAGIWIGAGIGLTLLGTLGLYAGALDPRALPGVLSIVLGTAYFATAQLARLRWLGGVAVAWWVAGAALLVWRGPWSLLALAALVLALEAGPALALRRYERRLAGR